MVTIYRDPISSLEETELFQLAALGYDYTAQVLEKERILLERLIKAFHLPENLGKIFSPRVVSFFLRRVIRSYCSHSKTLRGDPESLRRKSNQMLRDLVRSSKEEMKEAPDECEAWQLLHFLVNGIVPPKLPLVKPEHLILRDFLTTAEALLLGCRVERDPYDGVYRFRFCCEGIPLEKSEVEDLLPTVPPGKLRDRLQAGLRLQASLPPVVEAVLAASRYQEEIREILRAMVEGHSTIAQTGFQDLPVVEREWLGSFTEKDERPFSKLIAGTITGTGTITGAITGTGAGAITGAEVRVGTGVGIGVGSEANTGSGLGVRAGSGAGTIIGTGDPARRVARRLLALLFKEEVESSPGGTPLGEIFQSWASPEEFPFTVYEQSLSDGPPVTVKEKICLSQASPGGFYFIPTTRRSMLEGLRENYLTEEPLGNTGISSEAPCIFYQEVHEIYEAVAEENK